MNEQKLEQEKASAVDAIVKRLTPKMEEALIKALENNNDYILAHISTKTGLHDRGLAKRYKLTHISIWSLTVKGRQVAENLKSKKAA